MGADEQNHQLITYYAVEPRYKLSGDASRGRVWMLRLTLHPVPILSGHYMDLVFHLNTYEALE